MYANVLGNIKNAYISYVCGKYEPLKTTRNFISDWHSDVKIILTKSIHAYVDFYYKKHFYKYGMILILCHIIKCFFM